VHHGPAFRSGPPQIWPHLAVLLARALLWVSRHLQSQQIRPAMPPLIGIEFSLASE
jgi:hypothetical protein